MLVGKRRVDNPSLLESEVPPLSSSRSDVLNILCPAHTSFCPLPISLLLRSHPRNMVSAIVSLDKTPSFRSRCTVSVPASVLSVAARFAMNHTLSLLCGAPTAQAGITTGWTEYPSRSRSFHTVSTTYSCRCNVLSRSTSPNRDSSRPNAVSLPGCTIVRIPATFSPTTQSGCISRIARSISGQR